MSGDLRAYIEAQIERCRAFERKAALFTTLGPVPRRGKPPTAGQCAEAAVRAGDVAAERMRWQAALRLLP